MCILPHNCAQWCVLNTPFRTLLHVGHAARARSVARSRQSIDAMGDVRRASCPRWVYLPHIYYIIVCLPHSCAHAGVLTHIGGRNGGRESGFVSRWSRWVFLLRTRECVFCTDVCFTTQLRTPVSFEHTPFRTLPCVGHTFDVAEDVRRVACGHALSFY